MRYIVTGAYGHLGRAVVNHLADMGKTVWRLVLPGEQDPGHSPATIVEGDVRNPASLEELFIGLGTGEATVIHTAGIVTVASKFQQRVQDVNVTGTENIISLCERHRVKRLVHVSSVHAIPEKRNGEPVTETDHFDPRDVIGLYAKTKSEATARVLEARARGLDAVVVHPSGIVGPGDYGRGHLTQLVVDYCNGKLTACVRGGYDFVDVRDVAAGIVAAAQAQAPRPCYILSNQFYEVSQFLEMLHEITGRKRVKTVLPMWFAALTAPLSEVYYRLLRQPPLYTAYSLYTLRGNAHFSHELASRELGYAPRPLEETLLDSVQFLRSIGRIKSAPAPRRRHGTRPARNPS